MYFPRASRKTDLKQARTSKSPLRRVSVSLLAYPSSQWRFKLRRINFQEEEYATTLWMLLLGTREDA